MEVDKTPWPFLFLEGLAMRSEEIWKEKMEIPQWINEKEASRIMGVALQTLRNWRSQRKGPSYFVVSARMIRYRLSDLIDFMEQRKVNFDKE